MNMTLTEEQSLLRDAARRFLETECPEAHVRAMEDDPLGYSPDTWSAMAGLGWQGLMLPEALGGAGLTAVDLAILVEEMGRALLPGPFLPNQCVAALLTTNGTEAQQREHLPGIASGEAIHTYALIEGNGRWGAEDVRLEATPSDGGVTLDGKKRFVPDAQSAAHVWVFAREGTELVACRVSPGGAGVTLTPLPTISGDKQAELVLDGVNVTRGDVVHVGDFGRFADVATLLECAYLVGLTGRDFEITVAYAKERRQFDRPIGSFQAIQHKAADMASDVDGMRSITARAAAAVADGVATAGRTVAMAKAWCSDASRRVVAHGQQIHGGIGFTTEYVIGLYFRRQKRGELFWGDGAFHRERVARMLGV